MAPCLTPHQLDQAVSGYNCKDLLRLSTNPPYLKLFRNVHSDSPPYLEVYTLYTLIGYPPYLETYFHRLSTIPDRLSTIFGNIPERLSTIFGNVSDHMTT